jgi:hypothetical protein
MLDAHEYRHYAAECWRRGCHKRQAQQDVVFTFERMKNANWDQSD